MLTLFQRQRQTMKHSIYVLTIVAFAALSFSAANTNEFNFSYPKRSNTTLTTRINNVEKVRQRMAWD